MALKGTKEQARTWLLLTLWELSETGDNMKKSELTKKLPKKGEKVTDYEELFTELVSKQVIRTSNQGRTKLITCNSNIVQDLLLIDLQSKSFQFGAIGKHKANALLRMIRELGKSANRVAPTPTTEADTISSYKEFKTIALNIYDQLNRDYNMDNLVPIYRIRRKIGDRVSRVDFDNWLLEMQTNESVQLIGGEMPELTPDKASDSIKTALGSVRYYAKRL